MKKLLTRAICAVAIISSLSACKKDDDDDVSPSSISGTYAAYEMEIYSPQQVIQLPADGSRGEIVVTVTADTLANLRILLYDNNTPVVDEQVECRVKHDNDEGIILEDISTNKMAAYLIEKNEIDVYWIPETRISARK